MKVLLGWELGGGQGHIQRLIALARSLETQGYTPIFALKSFPDTLPWQSLAAPRLPFSGRGTSHTFADILATFGFAEIETLKPHLQAWQTILLDVQPSLIVADHAPGLVLAAQGKVPTIVVGTHFTVPPPVEVFPVLRFPAPEESSLWQAQVSETVHQTLNLPVSLGEALNGDRSFIYSIPELDCYRAWRKNPRYVGVQIAPIVPKLAGVTQTWAYLAEDYADRDLVLQTLNPNTQVKHLPTDLAQTALAIHHGGLTTALGCLLAGVPQLILPRHLEQELNAIALDQLGVAKTLLAPSWEGLLAAAVQACLLSDRAAQQAKEFAHWNAHCLEQITQVCLSLSV